MTLLSRIEHHMQSAYLYEIDEKCWREVVAEPTGKQVIRAAKIFYEKGLIPPVNKTKILFSCGRELILEPEYRVALKKESSFFVSLFSKEEVFMNRVSYTQFQALLKALFEDAPIDWLDGLMLADYLELPSLFYRAFHCLKEKIAFASHQESIDLHDRLVPLRHFSFIRELFEALAKQFEKFEPHQIKAIYALEVTKKGNFDLRQFTNLDTLAISSPEIDSDLLYFSSSLTCLSLTFNSLVRDAHLSFLPLNLKSLMLGRAKLSNQGLIGLPAALTRLNIGGCQNITDEGVSTLPLSLTDLNVSSIRVSIESLTRLTALTRLNIVGSRISNASLQRLSVLELSLSDVRNEELICLPRHLRRLNISSSTIDTLKGLPPLIELKIRSACLIDESLLYLTRGLNVLDLSFSTSITAEGIKIIPRTVRFLTLWRCTKINDEAMKALPKRLIYLDVAGCFLITDAGIKALPQMLSELDISGCRHITDRSISFFPPNLSKVHISNTGITKKWNVSGRFFEAK